MPRRKPEIELVQIAVRLSPIVIKRLDGEAAASGRSRNGVISDALAFHVASQDGRRMQAIRAAEEPRGRPLFEPDSTKAVADKAMDELKVAEGVRASAYDLQVGPAPVAPGSRLKKR